MFQTLEAWPSQFLGVVTYNSFTCLDEIYQLQFLESCNLALVSRLVPDILETVNNLVKISIIFLFLQIWKSIMSI